MATYERRRVARREHPCKWGQCGRTIEPGDVYAEATEYPSGDAAYALDAGRPVRMKLCAPCVGEYDRTRLDALHPIPYEQCARQGLL